MGLTVVAMAFSYASFEYRSMPFICALPLPIGVGIFYRFCHRKYITTSTHMSYKDAKDVDSECEMKLPPVWRNFDDFLYADPEISEEELAQNVAGTSMVIFEC